MPIKNYTISWKVRDPSKLENYKPEEVNDFISRKVFDRLDTMRPDADIYVQIDESLEYSETLPSFLIKKGLTVSQFDHTRTYLESDVILLSDRTVSAPSKNTFYLSTDKAGLWSFLQDTFKERLK